MLKRVSSLTISDAIPQYQDGYLAARNLPPLTPLLYGSQRGKARCNDESRELVYGTG